MEATAASSGLANHTPFPVVSHQAATAHPRTDTHGVPKSWDYPNPCSHPGPQLSTDKAEPLQQPDHNALRLPQVRATSVGSEGERSLYIIYTVQVIGNVTPVCWHQLLRNELLTLRWGHLLWKFRCDYISLQPFVRRVWLAVKFEYKADGSRTRNTSGTLLHKQMSFLPIYRLLMSFINPNFYSAGYFVSLC